MKKILTILMLLVALVSCTPRVEVDHRMHEGNIDFCCDESYANVLAQQVFVFTRTNPGAFIDMTRCTERDVSLLRRRIEYLKINSIAMKPTLQ